MPKPNRSPRGGSGHPKNKPGRNSKGHRHSMTRLSRRKDAKRD